MEYVTFLENPELRRPIWIGAFVGWADAQEGASRAVRYLVRRLPATKFAELEPEEFYDFSSTRPVAYNNERGDRVLRWPSNEFYYWKNPETEQDFILFLGTEPNLKWRTYTSALLSVVDGYDLDLVVNLGSLLDAIPHTREPLLSGGANKDDVKSRLSGLRIMGSNYQGPVGITSALMDACTRVELDYMSIWVHAPHYVQRSPNFKLSRALVNRVNDAFGLSVPLERLEERGRAFEAEVTKAIGSNVEVSAYVKRLERQYDASQDKKAGSAEDLPAPEEAVEGVEDFLRGDFPGGTFSPN